MCMFGGWGKMCGIWVRTFLKLLKREKYISEKLSWISLLGTTPVPWLASASTRASQKVLDFLRNQKPNLLENNPNIIRNNIKFQIKNKKNEE